MPIEIVGMINTRRQSDTEPTPQGSSMDMAFLKKFWQAHERAGFDRALLVHSATAPDAWVVAQYGMSVTENIQIMLAHRPGFVSPTQAARKGATLDHVSGGRFGIHIITGGTDEDQARDGDFLSKPERYERSGEFAEIVKKVWTSDAPFDYEGKYYRLKGAYSSVKPLQQPHPPIYFGGSSEEGLDMAAKHADVWAMWCQPLAAVKENIDDVLTRASEHGRAPSFHVSFRPILASTEAKAWERAYAIRDRMKALRGNAPVVRTKMNYRLQALKWADVSEVHDDHLWLGIAKETGMSNNHTALVGTPEQVAELLLKYYEIGVSQMLFRGYSPLEDAIDYGRELFPRLREGVRLRDLRAGIAAPVAPPVTATGDVVGI